MQIFDSNNHGDNLSLMHYNTGNMSASLGGLLKDYRLQKNIPQMEIAFALGWKDTSRLSRIEQGIVEKPPRELIDEICKMLQLTDREKNHLLLAGNYIPTLEEIEKVRIQTKEFIEQFAYPVAIFDFCSRNIAINTKMVRVLGMSKADVEAFHTGLSTMLELLFDPNFPQNKYFKGADLKEWHHNLVRVLIHFRSVYKTILKDTWFLGVVKKMMNNDLFRESWKRAQNTQTDILTTRYGNKAFVNPKNHAKKLTFNFFVVPLHDDPRFEIEFFNPADAETTEFFH